MDRDKIEQAVRLILEAIGEDVERIGLRETPQRVATMFEEIFAGVGKDAEQELKMFTAEHHEMIIHRDIPFYSMCEHHLLPFWGFTSIAYIPKDSKVTGFSSLARIVRVLSQRPQLQETMVTDIADAIMRRLKPMGVFVVIRAQHLCLMMRGEKVHGSWTVTSAVRGVMTSEATRLEALHLMDGH
ncbi:GTP cyclohydrolase I FolE [bacterium]|nr:GTP cyclohydrolase I FolE [bacterium]MBU1985295.1 GTP cyclohydrolase I FolE [bacterium]